VYLAIVVLSFGPIEGTALIFFSVWLWMLRKERKEERKRQQLADAMAWKANYIAQLDEAIAEIDEQRDVGM